MGKRLLFYAFLLSLLFPSCTDLINVEIPYYISEKKVEMGKDDDICSYAEAVFEIFNNSDKEIESVDLSFYVFDDRNMPSSANNKVEVHVPCHAMARNAKSIKVSLDPYIGPVIREQYSVGFSYVSKISYTDGTVWMDQWGVYGLA
jgi:hypothetical protein